MRYTLEVDYYPNTPYQMYGWTTKNNKSIPAFVQTTSKQKISLTLREARLNFWILKTNSNVYAWNTTSYLNNVIRNIWNIHYALDGVITIIILVKFVVL